MSLKEDITQLRRSHVGDLVRSRLEEFSAFRDKDDDAWFSELCFCLLTANSKARTAIAIQEEIGAKGFCELCVADLAACIRENKHRFHNNKARFIFEARTVRDIKARIKPLADKDQQEAREWLADNIKGLGFKEASHFLRNVGYFDLAILDRHILRTMAEEGLMEKRSNSLTRRSYIEAEEIFQRKARELGMQAAELDMYMWYLKARDVLK